MTEREALKLALKALESLLDSFERCEAGYPQHIEMRFAVRDTARIAIDRATEALAQPEQEPMVWMYVNKSTHEVRFQKHMRDFVDHGAFLEVPLFSEPLANQEKTSGSPIAQRKPLTDEECIRLAKTVAVNKHQIRAIEAAHGIKEST